jgi:hypothetical protein
MHVVIVVATLALPFLATGSISWARTNAAGEAALADALLLYNGTETNAGFGFEKAVALYGLTLTTADLAPTTLTDVLLRDSSGAYYPLVFIDGTQLDSSLNSSEAQVLVNAVNNGGLSVLITNFRVNSSAAINTLTGGEVTGSSAFNASSKNYTVSQAAPDVTRQLSGVNVRHSTPASGSTADYKLAIAGGAAHTQVLAVGTEDGGAQRPIFARYKNGAGSILIASNYTDPYLKDSLLKNNYYVLRSDPFFTQQWFSQIMPLLMGVRFAAGDRAWHSNHNYANFTVDDPKLLQSAFDYAGMLQQTTAHNFHFTLAVVPAAIDQREQTVVDIFRNNPDRMSLVQHGDTHIGYEFYRHVISPTDPYSMYVKSLAQQESLIVEGRTFMQSFSQSTGTPYGSIMVFPFGISPADTIQLLKKYNFQATINSSDVPLDTPQTTRWDAYMHPAEMSYNNFAVILRYGTGQSPYPFLFFLGKPVLEYDHISRFAGGIGAYNPYADTINSVYGGNVEWKSLDYIMKHLYQQKTNRDGSIGVQFWGNNIIVNNDTGGSKTYRIQREETLNVPIRNVSVNGVTVNYNVSNGLLQVTQTIPASGAANLQITYADGITTTLNRKIYLPLVIR